MDKDKGSNNKCSVCLYQEHDQKHDSSLVGAAKLQHSGIRVQQWSHTTTRQALWYNAWACHANASDAKKPGTSPDRDTVTMVDIPWGPK